MLFPLYVLNPRQNIPLITLLLIAINVAITVWTSSLVELDQSIVAAEYGEVIVVAGTNRFDARANVLLGLGLTDSAELWPYVCRGGPLSVRFANVPGGDNPANGHITQGEVTPEVVASCDGQVVRINPMTGPG